MKASWFAVLIALGATPALAATQVSHLSFRGQNLSADFLSVDDSACPQGVETFVSVQGGFTVLRDGSTTLTPLASVSVNVFDHCSSTLLLFAEGTTANQSLQIDPNLGSGSLHAVVPLFDQTHFTTIYATVDLSWLALNKPVRTNFHDGYRSGGISYVANSRGILREAQATGSITLSSCATCQAGNYVPKPSINAFIEKDAYREVTITQQRGPTAPGKQKEGVE